MDEQTQPRPYETPRMVDYGSLKELTASCLGGVNGDSKQAAGSGFSTGTSVCTSKP